MDNCFSRDYGEARDKFLAAASAAKARIESHPLNVPGPDGATLTTDAAFIGDPDAKAVLVTISGTHGVEGFFGSAVQTAWLSGNEMAQLGNAAVLHIHAINPYGFAWLRRTNETNVDLNRNWLDFGQPLPENPLYDELADDLCPREWSVESQTATGRRLQAWMASHDPMTFQAAVSQGQWRHPQGLFYGGTAPSWSRQTLIRILTPALRRAAHVCIIDFHTGLGSYGYAEPIVGHVRSDPGFENVRSWIGGAARSMVGDGSVSAQVKGDSLSALAELLPDSRVDIVAMECGLRPVLQVLSALRADAWLHGYGDPLSAGGQAIKRALRDCFHSDDPFWQGMALGQGLAACKAAIGGLHNR
jgi:hypothetical protein